MTRSTPARLLADRYLAAVVGRAQESSSARLPGVRELAAGAGVSYVTMQRAVAEAVRQGTLEASPRRGTCLAASGASVESSLPPLPQARHLQVTEAFERDIRNRVYAAGQPLPPAKQMAQAYGASAAALRRALALLVRRGRLERIGRRMRLPALRGARSLGRVALITRGDRTGLPARTTPRTEANLRAFEALCISAGVSLEVTLCDYVSGALLPLAGGARTSRDSLTSGDLLGVAVWPLSLQPQFVDRIMERALAARCPVAILMEQDTASSLLRAGGQVRLFQLADGVAAGAQVGRFLAGLGHRSVAWLTHAPTTDWSQQRLQGVRDGLGSEAEVLVCEGSAAEPLSRQQTAALQRATAMLDEAGKAFPLERQRSQQALQTAAIAFSQAMVAEQVRDALTPQFAEALARRGISAWVCANDAAAVEALAFLQREGVAVPAKVSVVGFDNSEEAFVRQLTSYDFNAAGLAQAQLGHLLHWPASVVRGPGRQTTVVDGSVVERASCALRR